MEDAVTAPYIRMISFAACGVTMAARCKEKHAEAIDRVIRGRAATEAGESIAATPSNRRGGEGVAEVSAAAHSCAPATAARR